MLSDGSVCAFFALGDFRFAGWVVLDDAVGKGEFEQAFDRFAHGADVGERLALCGVVKALYVDGVDVLHTA